MPILAVLLLLVLPLAACGVGRGPAGPAPGSLGEQELQESMPETSLFDENQAGGAGTGAQP